MKKTHNPATRAVRDALASLPPTWVSDELAQALEVRAASSAVARHLAEQIDAEQTALNGALGIDAHTIPADLEAAALGHTQRLNGLRELAARVQATDVPEDLAQQARTLAGRDVLAAFNALIVPPSRYEGDLSLFNWSRGGPQPAGVRPETTPPRLAEPPIRLPLDERVAGGRAKLDQAVAPVRTEILERGGSGIGVQVRWTSADVLVDLQRAASAMRALEACVPLADELRHLIDLADADRPAVPADLGAKVAALAAS